MRRKLLVAAAMLAASVAHADTTFYLQGTLTDGATFDGTLNWAPSGGILGAATFTSIDVTTSAGYSFSGAIGTIPESGEKEESADYGNISLITDSSVPTDAVMDTNFNGTFLCGTAELCGDEIGTQYVPGGPNYSAVSFIGTDSVATGTITLQPGGPNPASVTPEPSSIALLGTGFLGVVGVVRKRLA